MYVAAAMAGLQIMQSFYQAGLIKENRKIQEAQAEHNIKMKEFGASDARLQGMKKASQVKTSAGQFRAEQELAGAAQGQNLSSSSVATAADQTTILSERDIETIKNQAAREAFGFENAAQQIGLQDDFNAIKADQAYNETLITGGMKAVSGYMTAKTRANQFKAKTTADMFNKEI